MPPNQSDSGEVKAPYKHPTNLVEFEVIYQQEYQQELESCDHWIKWCYAAKNIMFKAADTSTARQAIDAAIQSTARNDGGGKQ